MKRFLLSILIIPLLNSNVFSFNYFENLKYSIGINSGINRISNEAQMPLFSFSDECGVFNSGVNFGYNFGLQFLAKNPKYSFYPMLNLFYESRPIYLDQQTDNFEVFDDRLNQYVPLIRNFEYDGTFGYAGMNFGVAYEPIKTIPFGIQLLFELSYPFLNSSYNKTESLIAPEGLKYPGGANNRIYESGDLPSANLLFSGIGGIFLIIDTKYFQLKPSVNYRYDFNSLTSDFSWKSNSFKFELTIIKELDFSKEEIPEIPEEPVEVKKEVVAEKPKEVEKERDFIRYFNGIPINILETVVTQTYPLLPYIFFDSASTELKNKYRQLNTKTNEFSENLLPKNTLGIYYQILNIIGYRMSKNPETLITLKAVTDGVELPTLEQRLDLAKKRAESVKSYISNKWDIDENRIIIEVKDYPDLPTSNKYEEGFEENRRVEIYSDNFELLQPVIHSKFIEYTSTQKELLFYAGFDNSELIKNYTIKFRNENDEFFHYHSKDRTDGEIKIRLNPRLISIIAEQVKDNDSMEVELEIVLMDGSIKTKATKVKVNKSLNQFEIGRLNLIVFDFDRDNISETNRLMIDNFVKTSLKDNSIVEITGSSDFLGPEQYNKNLSQRRADNTKQYLLEFKKDLNIKKCKGLGADVLLYDNASPEGRFYCRTVMIEVKSKIDK